MAEKKQAAKAAKKEAGQARQTAKKINSTTVVAAVIVIVIVALAVMVFFPQLLGSVPFSTFKANFQSAPNVSITATYSNETQYAFESACFSSIIQSVAHTRKANTINFFIVDAENSSCTYSQTGLGGSVVPVTSNSSYCLNIATSQPGVFLNYSSTNSTQISADRAYIYGNSNYMDSCPIAIELS